ncbi:MAG: ParB/RepB/Spo0J family partition protein [Chitinophagales bacterium]
MAKRPKKEALGMGIRSLLSDFNNAEDEKELLNTVLEIPLEDIEANPFQPRKDFGEESLQELADSIKTLGLIQPITVRELENGNFQLIAGERRLRAAKLAGLDTIPGYVVLANKQFMLEAALVENTHRKDLNPIEIAMSYQRLIDECKLTHEQVSERVGKKRSSITNELRLLSLPPMVIAALKNGDLTKGHCKYLLSGELKSEDQIAICQEIIEKELSVRQTDALIKSWQSAKKKPSASKDDKPDLFLQRVTDDLARYFDTKVEINANPKGKGKITIPFGSNEELNELLKKMKG